MVKKNALLITEPDVLLVLLQSVVALMSFSQKVASVDLPGGLFLLKLVPCLTGTAKEPPIK